MGRKINPQDVLNALRAVQDPDLHRDIVSLGFVKDLEVGDNRVSFTIELTTPACPVKDQLAATAKQAVQALGVPNVDVRATSQVTSGVAARSAVWSRGDSRMRRCARAPMPSRGISKRVERLRRQTQPD